MKRIALLALLAVPVAAAYAQDKPLTGDEVKALVSGKTLRFPVNANGTLSNFKLESDGTGSGNSSNLKWRNTLSYTVKWRVDDGGKLCTHVQQAGSNEYCSEVQKGPENSYLRVRSGKVEGKFTVD